MFGDVLGFIHQKLDQGLAAGDDVFNDAIGAVHHLFSGGSTPVSAPTQTAQSNTLKVNTAPNTQSIAISQAMNPQSISTVSQPSAPTKINLPAPANPNLPTSWSTPIRLSQHPSLENQNDINVGHFPGSGIIENFLNSPLHTVRAVSDTLSGDLNPKEGAGQAVKSALEGPLGLIPIGRGIEGGLKGASLGAKIVLGAKAGFLPGAAYGGAYGGAQAASQNAPAGQIAKQAVIGGLTTGALNAGIGGATPIVADVAKNFKNAPESGFAKIPGKSNAPENIPPNINPETGKPWNEGVFSKQDLANLEEKSKQQQVVDAQELNKKAYDNLDILKSPNTTSEEIHKAFPSGEPDLSAFEGNYKSPEQAALDVALRRKPGTYDEAVNEYIRYGGVPTMGEAQQRVSDILENVGAMPVGGFRGEYAKGESPLGLKPLSAEVPEGEAKMMKSERSTTKITSLENRANKIGPSGQEFAQRAVNKRVDEQVLRQQMIDKAEPFLNLSEEDQARAWDIKESGKNTNDPRIQSAVDSLRQLFPDVRQTGLQHGIAVSDAGKTYMPHSWDRGYFNNKKNFSDAVKYMVKTHQVSSTQAAVKLLNKYRNGDYMGGRIFSNLEMRREFNLPGYRKNGDAILDYIKGASRRIAEAKNFGPNNEEITGLISRAVDSGEDATSLQKIVNAYLNPKTSGQDIGSRALTGYQKVLNVVQLPKAAISHALQGLANTASQIGFGRYFKAVNDRVFSKESQDFLHEAGFHAEKYDKNDALTNRVTAPLLRQVRQFHREVAGVGGREYALGLAERGDEAGLRKAGVTGELSRDEAGKIGLTHEQEVQAAHALSDKTIFANDTLQSPVWTQGNVGKFISQYKRAYVFKQSELIQGMFRDARHGNAAPLLRYLAIGVPVSGLGVTVAKNVITGKKEKNAKELALDSLRNSGVLSIGYGTGESAQNALRYNYNNDSRWANAGSAVAPGLGTAIQTGQNIAKATHGNPIPLQKEVIKDVPLAGTRIANKIFPVPPPKAQDATDAYFNQVSASRKNLSGQQLKDFDAMHASGTTINGVTTAKAYDPNSQSEKYDKYTQLGSDKAPQLNKLFQEEKKLSGVTAGYPQDPLFKLNGTGTAANGDSAPKALIAMEYNKMPDGDPQKPGLLQANGGSNGWLSSYEQDRFSYGQNYKSDLTQYMQSMGYSQGDINKYWQAHPSNPDPLQAPQFSKNDQTVLDNYFNLLNSDTTQASQYFKDNSTALNTMMAAIAKHQNDMRIATGNEPLQNYPVATPEITQLFAQMPTGTDKASNRATAIFINSHPILNQYLANVSLYTASKVLSENRYVNPANPSLSEGQLLNSNQAGQKAMKDIVNIGRYDIGKNSLTGQYSFLQSGGLPTGTSVGGGSGGSRSRRKPLVSRPPRVTPRKVKVRRPPNRKTGRPRLAKSNRSIKIKPLQGLQPIKVARPTKVLKVLA